MQQRTTYKRICFVWITVLFIVFLLIDLYHSTSLSHIIHSCKVATIVDFDCKHAVTALPHFTECCGLNLHYLIKLIVDIYLPPRYLHILVFDNKKHFRNHFSTPTL